MSSMSFYEWTADSGHSGRPIKARQTKTSSSSPIKFLRTHTYYHIHCTFPSSACSTPEHNYDDINQNSGPRTVDSIRQLNVSNTSKHLTNFTNFDVYHVPGLVSNDLDSCVRLFAYKSTTLHHNCDGSVNDL
jgi:hypothetical protein